MGRLRVAINGHGVIGKRVVDAVTIQDDMEVSRICAGALLTRLAMSAVRATIPSRAREGRP